MLVLSLGSWGLTTVLSAFASPVLPAAVLPAAVLPAAVLPAAAISPVAMPVPVALAYDVPPDYSHRSFLVGGATVSIDWDSHGTPQVDSTSDRGAFFGWGYAMAVDRFFQMEMARRDVLGKQAELLGADPNLQTFLRDPLARDEEARRLRLPFFLQDCMDHMQSSHPDHVDLLQGFSDGVNQYLVEKLGPTATWIGNPNFPNLLAGVHPLFQTYPLTGTRFSVWTPRDCLASLWHVSDGGNSNAGPQVLTLNTYRYLTTANPIYQEFVSQAVLDRLVEWSLTPPLSAEQATEVMLGSSVFDEDAATVKELDVPQQLHDDIFAYAAQHGWAFDPSKENVIGHPEHPDLPQPHFSHAFAVGGDRTSNGRAVVVGMPQLLVTKDLFEIAVRGASFTSRGIAFPGCPGFLVGFNEDVGWSVTSAGGSIDLVYELRQGKTGLQFDRNKYRFNGTVHTVSQTVENIPVRTGSTWTTSTVTVNWGDDLHHDATSDPSGEQKTRFGLPIVTDWISMADRDRQDLDPTEGTHYAILSHRYFDNTTNTLDCYLDMLTAHSVQDIDTALEGYVNPAVSMVAGDKDGNVGFWYLKSIPLHSPMLNKAPLGVFSAMSLNNAVDLCTDIIPIHLLPHVINPANQLVAGVRSPIEDIVITGNSCVVGSWYPLPAYGGYGDTLRSLRFRQLLSESGDPDHVFTPEDLLALCYDDVNPMAITAVRAIEHQQANQFATDQSYPETQAMLDQIESGLYPDWVGGGGHMHSAHPLTGGLVQMDTVLRFQYRDLCRQVGQAEHGKCRLIKLLDEALEGPPVDIFDVVTGGDAEARADLAKFLAVSVGNGYSRATTGHSVDDGPNGKPSVQPLGPVIDWKPQYLQRVFGDTASVGSTTVKVIGARVRIRYHDDLLAYGSLDPTHDIVSDPLHNVAEGVGDVMNNFYSQCVHFRWHDAVLPQGIGPDAYTVFHTGNSLHPTSPYFNNSYLQWLRDGLLFDLDAAQANPGMYFRDSPLIQ